MVNKVRELLAPILDSLQAEGQKAFKQKLRFIRLSAPLHDYLGESHAANEAVDALEENARAWIADAVNQASGVTRAPVAFAIISETLETYVSELLGDIQMLQLTSGLHGGAEIIDQNRLSKARQRLERQLDLYQGVFSDTADDKAKSTKSPAGRKPEYDWLGAANTIWGRIYRGNIHPKKQVEIEVALMDLLGASEATVRPYAKLIWQEMEREA